MQLLLDTHILLWAMSNDKRLPREAARMIIDSHNRIFVSAVSFWEIAVKKSLGKISISLPELKRAVAECHFVTLNVTTEHCISLAELPILHRDPFDRMLVAQSKVEPALLLTADDDLEQYGSTVMVI